MKELPEQDIKGQKIQKSLNDLFWHLSQISFERIESDTVSAVKSLVRNIDRNFLVERESDKNVDRMLQALMDGKVAKLRYEINQIKRKTTVQHNDYPFMIGDRVRVYRMDNCFKKAGVSSVVVERQQNPKGKWNYVVRTDEGVLHSVSHTRDMKKEEN